MLLTILFLNVITHNCEDIIFKIVCDFHDKCEWEGFNCFDTTPSTTTSKTKKTSSTTTSSTTFTTSNSLDSYSPSLSKSKKTAKKSP